MAVAGKFGCMQECNPELESFETYEECLKLYFEANDVAVSIIGKRKLKALFPDVKVQKSDILLKTYTSEPIEVIEEIEVEVHYQQQTQKLVLVVVAEEGPVLLGRNWLKHVILDWALICRINSKQISKMEKYPDVFIQKYPDVFIGSSYCEIIR